MKENESKRIKALKSWGYKEAVIQNQWILMVPGMQDTRELRKGLGCIASLGCWLCLTTRYFYSQIFSSF